MSNVVEGGDPVRLESPAMSDIIIHRGRLGAVRANMKALPSGTGEIQAEWASHEAGYMNGGSATWWPIVEMGGEI